MTGAATSYVGRFAPSPTGPLHEGSLLTAVASYLHARQSGGRWLVRIEDIDPPRESPGAASAILATLDALDLHWDDAVLYQSTRLAVYEEIAATLRARGLAFECSCTRSELRTLSGGSAAAYPGTCRARRKHDRATALRMRVDAGPGAFADLLQGTVEDDVCSRHGDYIIRRRDALPAYHLAVVVDDALQGVTTIVRGVDLLDSTGPQRHLQQALGSPTPHYAHVPVVVDRLGQKLSKQTGAAPIAVDDRSGAAARTLARLGASVPADLLGARPAHLWSWAAEHWRIDSLRGITAVRADE